MRALYVGEYEQKKKGSFQHSSFLAGGATIAAGRLVVKEGVLKAVWPYSGHYLPTEENFKEFINFLQVNNVGLTDVSRRATGPVDDYPLLKVTGSDSSTDTDKDIEVSRESTTKEAGNLSETEEEHGPISPLAKFNEDYKSYGPIGMITPPPPSEMDDRSQPSNSVCSKLPYGSPGQSIGTCQPVATNNLLTYWKQWSNPLTSS